MCNCLNYLIETANKMTTNTGITYKVFICENCKKYYIKRFKNYLGVKFDHDKQCWEQTGDNILAYS